MAANRNVLVTGATSGLGLEACRSIARQPEVTIIAGVRQPQASRDLKATVPADRLVLFPLDLVSFGSVRDFTRQVREWIGPSGSIDAIACNAGLQVTNGLNFSADGFELTFAVNHLAHFLLVDGLFDRLAPGGAVIFTASGTHDPKDKLARLFGFRGGLFPSAEAVSRGALDPKAKEKQLGLDRYATSKLCAILYTYEMARRVDAARARFIAFDPGLMPGTGLARDRSAVERFGWSYVMPVFARALPGASTTPTSGAALARLLVEPSLAPGSGLHFDFNLRQTQTSPDTRREDWARDLFALSDKLIGKQQVGAAG
ncbi:MAG: hypothetical protein RL291_183 [Pseudomonadota bacterium]